MLMDFFTHKYPRTDFHELNLDYILEHFPEILEDLEHIGSWIETHETEYNELKALVDDIEAGDLPEAVYNNLVTWLQDNAYDIIGEMIKLISVGLTPDGHLLITIPQQWKDITFRVTGYDINVEIQPEFGHLCILY